MKRFTLCFVLLAFIGVPELENAHAQAITAPEIRYESVPDCYSWASRYR